MKEVHIIGNGQSSWYYEPDKPKPGIKLVCNLPPFNVPDAFGTVIVDFKMMRAIQEGSVIVPGPWILGKRPQLHMQKFPNMYMKYAPIIKEFYTTLPSYVPNYTDFSCGHMATHYAAVKHKPDIIHMYGFDSVFDFDIRSISDFYLPSIRDDNNTLRLTKNWRSIWPPLWKEFPKIQFHLHHKHDKLKVEQPKNVKVILH